MILLTTVALLAGVIGAGGFNLHLALEVMNNYEATNTGDFLRTNTLKQSVIPAINMIGKALIAMEGRDMVQKTWLIALTVLMVGVGLVSLLLIILKKMVPYHRNPAAAPA